MYIMSCIALAGWLPHTLAKLGLLRCCFQIVERITRTHMLCCHFPDPPMVHYVEAKLGCPNPSGFVL